MAKKKSNPRRTKTTEGQRHLNPSQRYVENRGWRGNMPEQRTLERARRDEQQGKAPSTQAGEFVREEMHHIREGKHGARSAKQAIAIGLSKARRSGVKLAPPRRGAKRSTKQSAKYARRAGAHGARRPAPRRSRAVRRA